MRIVCDSKIPFLRGVLEPYAEVLYLPGSEISAGAVKDADALIIRTRTVCTRELLEGSRVRLVVTATIGYDHIDTAWCESAGIEWRNVPGCNSGSVAQYITSVLCTLAGRFGFRFTDTTLGVVGVGNVGSKVAAAASALGMKVLLCDPPRARREGPDAFVSLDELISSSDIISLHVPLSKEGPDATLHLFDSERIASLRPEQILLNSSRGPVVDNRALKAALSARRLGAAVLDTWEGEPEVDASLLGLLAVATPHIAGYSADGKANAAAAAVQMVSQRFGLPLTEWHPESLPLPEQSLSFDIDADGKPLHELLCEAVLHSYNVMEDDARLRRNPELFEKLRGDYPVRREFSAFTVQLHGGSPEQASALVALGFNLR